MQVHTEVYVLISIRGSRTSRNHQQTRVSETAMRANSRDVCETEMARALLTVIIKHISIQLSEEHKNSANSWDDDDGGGGRCGVAAMERTLLKFGTGFAYDSIKKL